MREFKFRYKDPDGNPFYKTVTLPDDAVQLVDRDEHGREVYEGDILCADYNGVHYEYKAHLGGFATTDNGSCYITAKQFASKELKAYQ